MCQRWHRSELGAKPHWSNKMGRYSTLTDQGKGLVDVLMWVVVAMGVISGIVWVTVGN